MLSSELTAKLEAEIEENNSQLAEFELLVLAAEKNKGRINKRLLKHLPEGSEYNIQHGMYYITFPSGRDHLIGWVGSTNQIDRNSIENSDACYSKGASERIKNCLDLLKSNRFSDLLETFGELEYYTKRLEAILQAIEDKKLSSYYNPIYYDLLRLSGFDDFKKKIR